MTPEITRSPVGWLATAPDSYRLRIGVQAPSENEAITKFRLAVAAWERLAQDGADD